MTETTRVLKDEYGHEFTVPGPFPSIDHMKRANADAGENWFRTDTMRWFGTRIAPGVHAGRMFITSERTGFDYNSPRAYTVRVMHDDGTLSNASEYLAFPTLGRARTFVRQILSGEKSHDRSNRNIDQHQE